MALEVVISSDKKGSNPGGRCKVYTGKNNICGDLGLCYLKYCPTSSVNGVLNPQNQPIYEAMFLEMAKKVGLDIPDYFVIQNPSGENVSFSYDLEEGEKIKTKLNPRMKNYFVSKFVPHEVVDTGSLVKSLMASDKIYRDLLHIGNVSGRPDNYSLIFPGDGREPFMLYIDLGCGLVDARGGVMNIRKSLKKKYTGALMNAKTMKMLSRRFSKVALETKGGGRVNLFEFGEKIPRCCSINILDASKPFGLKKTPVQRLLGEGELGVLSTLYFLANEDFLRRYKGDPRLKFS